MAAITPQSRELVQIHARSKRVPAAPLYGPDLSNWPSRMVDAFVHLDGEQNSITNAEFEANHRR